jgi:hypothetical protein
MSGSYAKAKLGVPKCALLAHAITVLPATTLMAGHSRKSCDISR